MITNRFRKKALSASTLARAFTKTLSNARARGTLSAQDISRLARLSDSLNDNAYLRRSLKNNPFDLGTSFLFTGGRDTNASNVLRSLSNLNKPMPKNLLKLRGIIRDINNDITNAPVEGSVAGMPNSRKLLLQHIGDLLSFMQKMPNVKSPVSRANKELNDTLILLNNAVRRRNGKLRSYKLGLPIATDAAGRSYFRDKDGMFFKLMLMDADTGKTVHKVTRLLDNGRLLIPDYKYRQYWSDDGRRLTPGSIIEDNGRRLQPYNYADDGNLYVRRYIGDVTPPKAKPQAPSTKDTPAEAASALPTARPTETPAVDTSTARILPIVSVDASGNTVLPKGAPVGSTANSAATIFSIFGNPASTGPYRYGAPPKPQVRPQLEVAYNPTQNITVGAAAGAQNRAANQTTDALAPLATLAAAQQGSQKLPFFERLKQGTRLHLSRNRGVYGTLGGATIGSLVTNMLSGGGGSGISLEDLLRMSQWQQAYNMAVNQRSFWLRLFGDIQSVQGNFLNNLKNYGWTDLQIKAYRKRFAGA